MRNFDTIILHASATPPDWMEGESTVAQMKEIDRWHRARGWNGIGYHYIVGRDGTIVKGRHLNTTGAHVKGHNARSVGVCLIGGKWPDGRWGVKTDSFSDHFTPAQGKAVRGLIADLQARYPQIRHVTGHNDYTDLKGCPCFTVSEWIKGGSQRPVQRPDGPSAPSAPTNPLAALLRALTAFLNRIFGG